MNERRMSDIAHPNRFLASLPRSEFELVRPHLKVRKLVARETLFRMGDKLTQVYLPHSGIISLVVELSSGTSVEAAMVGNDGMVGASSVLDGEIALSTGIIQAGGEGSTLDGAKVRQLAQESSVFLESLIRHQEALFAQAQQSAACNAMHNVDARLARWLLRANDLMGGKPLNLTQEFIAQMLGVRRPTVTTFASHLQSAGLISYSRGTIEITDVAGLRAASCECYETVKRNYERLTSELEVEFD
jgi:CRP-like cAMP-binding protein